MGAHKTQVSGAFSAGHVSHERRTPRGKSLTRLGINRTPLTLKMAKNRKTMRIGATCRALRGQGYCSRPHDRCKACARSASSHTPEAPTHRSARIHQRPYWPCSAANPAGTVCEAPFAPLIPAACISGIRSRKSILVRCTGVCPNQSSSAGRSVSCTALLLAIMISIYTI